MNPLISEIPPSLIRTINAKKRPSDIDLGLGEPTLPPPLGPFEAALDWTRRHGSPYSPNAGLSELRAMIAQYVAGYTGRSAEAERVCVTVGSEEALFLAIKTVIDPARHEALIVEPCYLAYPKLCVLEGVRHRMVALDAERDFAPDARLVLREVRDETRLIVLNTPANPTSRIWPDTELRALADGLSGLGREDVFVLADEVYRELHYGDEPASIARYHDRTLIAGSLSKSSSLTGLRLGWLWGPTEVVAAAIKVHQFVNTAATTYAQRVAIELFSEPGALAALRPRYAAARTNLLRAAREFGVDLIAPEGAFYAFVRLPASVGHDSLAFAERVLETQRVVVVPGRAFGASGEGWLRLSWVAADDAVREGLRRIAEEIGALEHA